MSFIKHLLPSWRRKLADTTQTNESVLTTVDKELRDVETQIIEGKKLMNINTTTGSWLDRYGGLFGLTRRDDEDDKTFRSRIIEYVKLKRGTIPAIEAALREYLQDFESHIEIYEPHTNIFYLNKSKLNGKDHILGYYYTFAVIDIKFTKPFPIDVEDIIYDFKPAGVTVKLTFRPNSYNPDAEIIELPLKGSTLEDTSTRLRIMNGMEDILRGHITLGEGVKDEEETDLFILNKSKLNSLDRLTGSLAASRGIYNLASFSTKDLTFDEDTSIEDVFGETEEVSNDFYTRTDKVDKRYAEITLEKDKKSYVYFTMDTLMYLDNNYHRYLKEVNPSGTFDKEDFKELIKKPTIHIKLSTEVSPSRPSTYTVQIFNLEKDKWDSIKSGEVTREANIDLVSIGKIDDYITDGGIVFTRLKINNTKIDSDSYRLRIYFYELGFKNHMDTRPSMLPFGNEVTSQYKQGQLSDLNNEVNLDKDIDEDKSIWTVKDKLLGTDFFSIEEDKEGNEEED